MELILWRHADAEEGLVEGERKLTGKGLKQSERMAAWLKQQLPEDVLILVSPALRAQQTARALAEEFETTGAVGTAASPQSLLKAAGWPKGKGAVLVVGHQPTLGQTAALLMTGKPADWSIRKGAVWWLVEREREGCSAVLLRAVLGPDLL
ncbi:MAG: phosphohistidine phosphatase SixA [Betaproteobacteria bacterium]|nr:phosphohistidine phosphatase SixA [Betaproteobacteria bacterium]